MAQTPTKVQNGARSPGKAGQRAATPKAAPAEKKRCRKKVGSGQGIDDEHDSSFAAPVSGTIMSSANALSPVPTPRTPLAMTPLASPVAALAQAQPRPGGLLDAMRQRGTLPAAGVGTPKVVRAPGVVPAIPRTFGGPVNTTSLASTEAPSSSGRPLSNLSTGSNDSLGASPCANSPLKVEESLPSPAKPPQPVFDYSLSPLLPKACEAPSPLRVRTPNSPAPAMASVAASPPGTVQRPPAQNGTSDVKKRSREDNISAEPRTPTKTIPLATESAASKIRKRTDNQAEVAASPEPALLVQGMSPKAASAKGRKMAPPVPAFKQAPPEPEPWQLLRKIKLLPPSEEDNYEISDKGEDSEAEEPDRTMKRIPAWSANYLQLLDAQANVDPDTIFGSQVPICDLEAIFSDQDYMKFQKDRPRRRRGSSAEWGGDRLSRHEIGEYKRKMGHQKRWQAKIA